VLKITSLSRQSRMRTLKLEGEIQDRWVCAVRDACAQCGRRPGRRCLDLVAVTFVEGAGVQLLRDLMREGIEIIACSSFIGDLLQRDRGAVSDRLFPTGSLHVGKDRTMFTHLRVVRGISQSLFVALLMLTGCARSAQNEDSAQNEEHRVRNIVLVHGAWADGSGWKGVHDILVKDGYNVAIVQEPETSFKDDVAATKRVLAQQDGSCILVAHSYGGAVITEAGTDPSVAGLAYIAAHMPDAGENEADVGKRFPSDLSKSTAIKKTSDGFTYLDPAQFHEYFAADLSTEQAAFMARSQVLNLADNFKAVITTAAWRSKPSWMLVAAKDRTINPDLQRWYAARAKSRKVEVPSASHSVYVSRPKEVAALIEEAAAHAR